MTKDGEPFVLGPPQANGPVVVEASFVLRDINEINDNAETFEFTGVLTFKWRDPRQGFDPVAAGVDEQISQGNFQFNEISPGWYPQVVLVNESGLNQASGVVLRVRPDGTSAGRSPVRPSPAQTAATQFGQSRSTRSKCLRWTLGAPRQ